MNLMTHGDTMMIELDIDDKIYEKLKVLEKNLEGFNLFEFAEKELTNKAYYGTMKVDMEKEHKRLNEGIGDKWMFECSFCGNLTPYMHHYYSEYSGFRVSCLDCYDEIKKIKDFGNNNQRDYESMECCSCECGISHKIGSDGKSPCGHDIELREASRGWMGWQR